MPFVMPFMKIIHVDVLSPVHTSEFSLASFPFTSFICSCVQHKINWTTIGRINKHRRQGKLVQPYTRANKTQQVAIKERVKENLVVHAWRQPQEDIATDLSVQPDRPAKCGGNFVGSQCDCVYFVSHSSKNFQSLSFCTTLLLHYFCVKQPNLIFPKS